MLMFPLGWVGSQRIPHSSAKAQQCDIWYQDMYFLSSAVGCYLSSFKTVGLTCFCSEYLRSTLVTLILLGQFEHRFSLQDSSEQSLNLLAFGSVKCKVETFVGMGLDVSILWNFCPVSWVKIVERHVLSP